MMDLQVNGVGWHAGGAPVLRDVTLRVGPAEFVALMGRNGAGKSTLLDLIAGLRTPVAGEVVLNGRRVSAWSARELARTMSHLPQMLRAEVAFSAEQLVLMGRYPHAGAWTESAADRLVVEEAMVRCGCLEFRHRTLATLSGGERQRVLLAACLAQQPALLLLDEPATFLDIDQQLQCFSLLREEADRGATCIAVTHDINLALRFCTRLIVLAEKTLARDMPVDVSLETPEWLQLFSPRLDVTRTPAGHPWVWYT